MNNHLHHIRDAVIAGRHKEIDALVEKAIKDGVNLDKLINDAMIRAMDVVGQRFSSGEIFVPEMLASAATMKRGLDLVKPLMKDQKAESKGTVIMCTVKGDIHDIGKNLVIMMLEGAGFTVIDLGVNLTVDKLIEEVARIKPDVLGLSALLTTTMTEMKRVIEALETNGLRSGLKVMVGGAPVDAAFAEKIGADGYGEDAAVAVMLARRLISEK